MEDGSNAIGNGPSLNLSLAHRLQIPRRSIERYTQTTRVQLLIFNEIRKAYLPYHMPGELYSRTSPSCETSAEIQLLMNLLDYPIGVLPVGSFYKEDKDPEGQVPGNGPNKNIKFVRYYMLLSSGTLMRDSLLITSYKCITDALK
jgi:hypothetical protein